MSGKDHHHDGTGQINSSRAKRSPSPILSTAQTDGPSQDTRPDVLQPPITPSLDESKQAVVSLLPRPSHKADPCASQKKGHRCKLVFSFIASCGRVAVRSRCPLLCPEARQDRPTRPPNTVASATLFDSTNCPCCLGDGCSPAPPSSRFQGGRNDPTSLILLPSLS